MSAASKNWEGVWFIYKMDAQADLSQEHKSFYWFCHTMAFFLSC